ncbi:UNVERIFIED_CONTAM: hypothetical protein Sradi_6125200 [Sesamum radiatum]|uniref:Uncharacterized protein n=1 Tax=Sesamum radiatum TaxID=300843 RepID=A0AAW2KJT2_SESRA
MVKFWSKKTTKYYPLPPHKEKKTVRPKSTHNPLGDIAIHERWSTAIRTPTQATPYALVYGVEAVLPLKQQIPSLRIAIQEGLTEEENAQIRLEELEALDKKR